MRPKKTVEMKRVSIRLEPYQVSTINGIAKKNGETFTSVLRRMVDFSTNKVSEDCIAVSLDSADHARLKALAKSRGKSESDLAAEIISGCMRFM